MMGSIRAARCSETMIARANPRRAPGGVPSRLGSALNHLVVRNRLPFGLAECLEPSEHPRKLTAHGRAHHGRYGDEYEEDRELERPEVVRGRVARQVVGDPGTDGEPARQDG